MYVCMPAGLAVCMCIALRCIVFVSVSVFVSISVLYCIVLYCVDIMCTYMWLSSIVIAECSNGGRDWGRAQSRFRLI